MKAAFSRKPVSFYTGIAVPGGICIACGYRNPNSIVWDCNIFEMWVNRTLAFVSSFEMGDRDFGINVALVKEAGNAGVIATGTCMKY